MIKHLLLKEDIGLIGLRTTDPAPFPHFTMQKLKSRKENELAQGHSMSLKQTSTKILWFSIQLLVYGAWKSGMHFAKKKKPQLYMWLGSQASPQLKLI